MSFHAFCVAVFALILFGVLTQGCLPKGDKPITVPVIAPTDTLESPTPESPAPESPDSPEEFPQQSPVSPYGEDQPGTPKLKNLGIQFGRYDANTGRAGDFVFVHDPFYPKFFGEFGIIVEGSFNTLKRLPEFDFRTAKGTPIRAMIDGVIAAVEYQSDDNYYVWIRPHTHPNWIIEYDHVKPVNIEVGDHVVAGQTIATIENTAMIGAEFDLEEMMFVGGAELGLFEIMVLPPDRTYRCPTDYLHSEVESTIKQQIADLMSDWESFKGNESLYDEANMPTVGCLNASFTDDQLDVQ